MAETAEEQRARILKDWHPNNEANEAWKYDLALALGYEPESWDGMWKLTPDPFTYRNGYVIAREVITDADSNMIVDSDRVRTRLTAHPLPIGWQVIEDQRLTEEQPRYSFVSPRDLEALQAIPNY